MTSSTTPAPTAAPTPGDTGLRRYQVVGGCVDCSGDLEPLRRVPGVRQVRLADTTGVVLVDAGTDLDETALLRQAATAGITLAPEPPGPHPTGRPRPWWAQPALVALATAAMLVLAGLIAKYAAEADTAAAVLFTAAIAVGGIFPLREAIAVLRARRLSIGVLLVAAAIGAIALGQLDEAAILVVVFSLGEVLESYAADRARGSIRALMALTPPLATRLRTDGGTEQIPVEALSVGDLVLVRPGQRIPTDGTVIDGASWVDTSAVTGESMPTEASAGTGVFGGTLNGQGALRVEVTTPYRDTVLARIIRQVEAAQANRGRAQRFAQRFGAIYTPTMFALAAAVAALGPTFGLTFTEAVYRALVVLVVSCSCALVISVPVAVVAAIARGARDGILIKGGAHLEHLAAVDTIAFDKTGTLTRCRPTLLAIHPLDGHSNDDLLAIAAAVETAATHPIADAIVHAATNRGLPIPTATAARTLPGIGSEATINQQRLHVGRLEPAHTTNPATAVALAAIEDAGLTPVAVTNNGQLIGLLGLADQLRPDAPAALSALRRLGITHTVMLTGDHPRVAAAIGQQVGISQVHAGLLPDDKTRHIQTLRDRGAVAMVGDGINDAPAMAHAHVAVAMGAAGTDVALETADVALMADDLTRLPTAIALARRTRRIVAQNITLSLATIAILVAFALAGGFTITQGILLNEGTALLIIANGLRLLRRKEA